MYQYATKYIHVIDGDTVDAGRARLPAGGRAPGWDAGLVVAGRQAGSTV